MYFCRDCGRQFQSGQRIDNVCLWSDYLTEKRTISGLSTLHKCSERTIRRRLSSVADSFTPIYPESATIILDTTYFSKTFGVMLFQDAASGRILHRRFVRNETNKEYLEGLRCIKEGGTRIKAVVCDGHVGLLQAVTSCPVQMCQFHQLQIVRRLLTNNPHLPAGIELLALMRGMFSIGKEEFTSGFDKWCDEWEEFLNERTLLISGKTTYTHRRLRSARRSVKTHLKWLYTYEEYPELEIPNTTNLLEGFNSQLKKALRNHNGMKEVNKKKFIDGFLNIKSRLELPAYQMSITKTREFFSLPNVHYTIKNEKEKCCFYLKSCEIEIISVVLQPKKIKLITKRM